MKFITSNNNKRGALKQDSKNKQKAERDTFNSGLRTKAEVVKKMTEK